MANNSLLKTKFFVLIFLWAGIASLGSIARQLVYIGAQTPVLARTLRGSGNTNNRVQVNVATDNFEGGESSGVQVRVATDNFEGGESSAQKSEFDSTEFKIFVLKQIYDKFAGACAGAAVAGFCYLNVLYFTYGKPEPQIPIDPCTLAEPVMFQPEPESWEYPLLDAGGAADMGASTTDPSKRTWGTDLIDTIKRAMAEVDAETRYTQRCPLTVRPLIQKTQAEMAMLGGTENSEVPMLKDAEEATQLQQLQAQPSDMLKDAEATKLQQAQVHPSDVSKDAEAMKVQQSQVHASAGT